MNADTICLKAVQAQDILRLSLWNDQDTLIPVKKKKYSETDVRKLSREVVETLNHSVSNARMNQNVFEKIKNTGTRLCDHLLTAEIKEYIENTDPCFLEIRIDDRLDHIPWELLYIGNSFLCRKFSMGRIVNTTQSVEQNRRSQSESLEMLILANPEGDLEKAGEEGDQILNLFDIHGKKRICASLLRRSEVKADIVKEKIRNFDIIHYSGHAEFDSTSPNNNGWKLSDGYFTPHDISGMVGGQMPFFIFSNACQSARTNEWNDNSFSMVNAFLRKGVRHYLGTFWKISDEHGNLFAQEFYRHFLTGKSIGEAVRLSREILAEKYGQKYIGWADYLLYGKPSFNLFQNDNNDEPVKVPYDQSKNKPDSRKSFQYSRGGPPIITSESDVHEEDKPANKLYRLFIAIAVLIVFFTFTMILFIFRQTSVPEAPNPEIIKILADQAEKKRQRINNLYRELEKITDHTVRAASSSDHTSEALTLAMVFDSEINHYETRNILAYAVQSRLKEALPELVLLHRKSLDKILEELIREKPEHLTLRFPELLLFLEVSKSESETYVLMQLVRKNTSEISAVFTETLDNSEFILEQKEKITQKLVEHLQEYHRKSES